MRTTDLDISVIKTAVKPSNRLTEKPNEQKTEVNIGGQVLTFVEPRQTTDIKTKEVIQQAQVQANNVAAIVKGEVPPNQTINVEIPKKTDIKITRAEVQTIKSFGKVEYWLKYKMLPFLKKPLVFIPAALLAVLGLIKIFKPKNKNKYGSRYKRITR